jgi:hypothetical protein
MRLINPQRIALPFFMRFGGEARTNLAVKSVQTA